MRSQNKETNIWDQIYSFAKKGEIEELKKMIAAGNCIGVFKGEYTPIMVLAKEGNLEAVKLLIQQFDANAGEALYGAILRNSIIRDSSEIIEFLTTQPNLNKNYYLLAYGQLGNEESINQWLDPGYDINFAVKGAGRGGHMRLVHKLIKKGANPVEAITGLVLGGFIKEAKELTVEYGESFRHLVKALAIQGKEREVNNLLKIHGEPECIYSALCGYSFGGFQEQADALHNNKKKLLNRTDYKNFKNVDCWKYRLQGHAEGGQNIIYYFELMNNEDVSNLESSNEISVISGIIAKQLTKKFLIKDNICYYAHGGHEDAVNCLNDDKTMACQTMANHIGSVKLVQKTLSQIIEFRKTLANKNQLILTHENMLNFLFYYKASVNKINEITNSPFFLQLHESAREHYYQKIFNNFVEMHHPINQKNLLNFLVFLDNAELRSYVINSYDSWNNQLDNKHKDHNFNKEDFIKKIYYERNKTLPFLLSLKYAKTRIEEISDEKEKLDKKESGSGFKRK